MREQFLPVLETIFHTETEFHAFGFDESSPIPKLLPNQIHQEKNSQKDQNLLSAGVAVVGRYKLVRTGPIDSPLRMQELNALLTDLSENNTDNKTTPDRNLLLQLANPEIEFFNIKLQRFLTSKFSKDRQKENSIAHINLPANPFYYSETSKGLNVKVAHSANTLSEVNNIEGLLHYSHWITEEFDSLLKFIALDDTIKFSLEAGLKDFSHETMSPLLNTNWQEIEEKILILGDQLFSDVISDDSQPYDNMLQDEKQLLELRLELHTYLQTQDKLLDRLSSQLQAITPLNKQLEVFQAMAQLYKELLDQQTNFSGATKVSLGKQLLLITLLNSALNVTMVINSNSAQDRTGICFSISLALLQLLQTESLTDIAKFVIEWDTNILSVNRWVTEKRHDAFITWLKGPTKDHPLFQPSRLTTKLRLLVYNNLQTFELPLLIMNSAIEHEKLDINQEYLNFLPDRFVEYDAKSGQPIGVKSFKEKQNPLFQFR